MKIGTKMRRKLLALAFAMAGSVVLALAVKAWDGPDWVTVPFICGGLYALVHLLMLCDALTCAADKEQAATDQALAQRVRRTRQLVVSSLVSGSGQ